jgi:hypothetical protein
MAEENTKDSKVKVDRAPNWSTSELLSLIEACTRNRDILRPAFDAKIDIKQKRRAWNDILSSLNACNPLKPRREKAKVQKKWSKMVSEAKEDLQNYRQKCAQTGV